WFASSKVRKHDLFQILALHFRQYGRKGISAQLTDALMDAGSQAARFANTIYFKYLLFTFDSTVEREYRPSL
ncbi:hypothetical protein CQA82_27490, partial [Escherichia coli]